MKYKVGDKVKIKTYKQLLKICDIDSSGNLELKESYKEKMGGEFRTHTVWASSMKNKICGKEILILSSKDFGKNTVYWTDSRYAIMNWLIENQRKKVELIMKDLENE